MDLYEAQKPNGPGVPGRDGKGRGETLSPRRAGVDISRAAKPKPAPAVPATLMEEILDRENLNAAWRRVLANDGAPGIDGMTAAELLPWLQEHGPKLREDLAAGRYRPQPVRRTRIPKSGGGERELGIPTVVDRFVQQAVAQVLQRHRSVESMTARVLRWNRPTQGLRMPTLGNDSWKQAGCWRVGQVSTPASMSLKIAVFVSSESAAQRVITRARSWSCNDKCCRFEAEKC